MARETFLTLLLVVPSLVASFPSNPITPSRYNSNSPNSFTSRDIRNMNDFRRQWPSTTDRSRTDLFFPSTSGGNSDRYNNLPNPELVHNYRGPNRNVHNNEGIPGMTPHRSQMTPVVQNFRPDTPVKYDPGNRNEEEDDNTVTTNPFQGCERHNGGHKLQNNHQYPQKMATKSAMAVYPMVDLHHPVLLSIKMKERQYLAKIEGTLMELRRCLVDAPFEMCEREDLQSLKGGDLFSPQQWNYIYSQFNNDGMVLNVNEKVNLMTRSHIPREDLENAEWIVTSDANTRDSGVSGGDPFVVEFPCAEYVQKDFPALPTRGPVPWLTEPHHHWTTHAPRHYTDGYHHYTGAPVKGVTDEPPHTNSHQVTIILVIVIAVTLAIIIVVMGVSIYRKRSRLTITESTPLSEQQQQSQTVKETQGYDNMTQQ